MSVVINKFYHAEMAAKIRISIYLFILDLLYQIKLNNPCFYLSVLLNAYLDYINRQVHLFWQIH